MTKRSGSLQALRSRNDKQKYEREVEGVKEAKKSKKATEKTLLPALRLAGFFVPLLP